MQMGDPMSWVDIARFSHMKGMMAKSVVAGGPTGQGTAGMCASCYASA